MMEILLTQTEFLKQKGPFRFEVNPLDVNLAKMQHALLERVPKELYLNKQANSVEEKYESHSPQLEVSTIMVDCSRSGNDTSYNLWLTVYDKEHRRIHEQRLASGSDLQINTYLESSDFVPTCKGYVLYYDYEYKHIQSFEDYVQQLILRTLRRAEKEVPEQGDFPAVRETFTNVDVSTRSDASRYGLEVYKMPDDVQPDRTMRYVEAIAYEPSGQYRADMIVASGSIQTILETMQSDPFLGKVVSALRRLTDSFD